MDATPALELAELLAVDSSSLSLRERVEHQAAIERVRNKLDAVLLGRVAEFEQSGAWQEDAASSAINWFQGQIGGARNVMACRVKLAKHLALMPGAREAFEEGAITESHAKVLSRCVANPRVRDRFAEDEAVLVALATELNADQLATQVDAWIRLHDQDGAEPHDRAVVEANPEDPLGSRTPGTTAGPRPWSAWCSTAPALSPTLAVVSRSSRC